MIARVLPVPAPAMTATGPLSAVATARCSGSSPASSDSAETGCGTVYTLGAPTDSARHQHDKSNASRISVKVGSRSIGRRLPVSLNPYRV